MVSKTNAKGVLLGLACGDALGRPVESKTQEEIAASYGTLRKMYGNGVWEQPPGTVTENTELALCTAHSLVQCDSFDPSNIATRFVDWFKNEPFDIGNTTELAIKQLQEGRTWNEAGHAVWENRIQGTTARSESAARCPPLAIAYVDSREILSVASMYCSQITHADELCSYGCAVLNLTIAGYLRESDQPLRDAIDWLGEEMPVELETALSSVAAETPPSTLETTGHVVDVLQTTLYDATTANGPEEAIVSAVNRGGDTNAVGAITGALAGARFGADSLPTQWLDVIDEREELADLAVSLTEN